MSLALGILRLHDTPDYEYAITGTGGSPDSGAAELDNRLWSVQHAAAVFRLADLP